MKKPILNILLPLLLILAVGIILFFQFNAYKSVKQLIGSNEELLDKINYKNKFQLLQTHLATFDKLVREAVITKGGVDDNEIRNEIKIIDSTIAFIDQNLPNDDEYHLSELLDSLVNLKIDNGINIHNEYVDKGKQEAELMVYYHNKSNTNERILKTIKELEELSEQKVRARVKEIDNNEKNAMRSNVMIAIAASLFLLLTLVYIFNKIKLQQSLIYALHISQEKEKKSAKVKEDFLANISHEIRTPLNAIVGFTKLLEKENLTEKESKFVSTIKSSSEHLMNIVNEILDIAKLDEGMIRIEHTAFNLKGTIEKVRRSFEESIQEKAIVFDVQYMPVDIITINGDEYRLTQILNNLLSNALKFTSKGKITLLVQCKRKDTPNCLLEFIVTDTGIGISKSKLTTVFDRFEQEDTHITRKYGGTGLGLAIVKQLVELQGGTIHVESEQGLGSVFSVELPFETANESNPHLTSIERKEKGQLKLPAHVLIVEDNRINQQLLEHLFNEKNIQYKIAANGREALDLLSQHAFDLILMDIQMPEMDGYAVADEIRNRFKLTVPIIAMTAHAMSYERNKCLSLGMNDYLSKPISEEELFAVLSIYADSARKQSVVDRSYLQTLSHGNDQFINELLAQFLIQAPQELTMLKKAYDMKDMKLAKATAHSMKTTFGYLGISHTHLMFFEEIENADTDTDIKQVIEKITHLYKQANADCEALLMQQTI